MTHSLLCSKSAIYPNYIKIIRNRISSNLKFTLTFNNPEIPDNSIFLYLPLSYPFFQNILHPFTITLNLLIHNTLKGEEYPSPSTYNPFTKTAIHQNSKKVLHHPFTLPFKRDFESKKVVFLSRQNRRLSKK